jgi:hypothetical protein
MTDAQTSASQNRSKAWTCNDPIERRVMSWDDEGSLFNELYWLADGMHPYESSTKEEQAAAYALCDRYIGSTHEEPEGPPEWVYNLVYGPNADGTINEADWDELTERLSQVEVAWLKTDWAVCDRLLAGIELVAGYKFPGEPRWLVNSADKGAN